MSIKNRYEFVLFFDVKDGNPNGDPDAGNLPRTDIETGHGLVTDVCLKRKIRNYVGIEKKEQESFKIYVKEKAVLNQVHEAAYQALDISLEGENKKRKGKGDEVDRARDWMCKNFFDIRTFGAVMSTGVNCGQVRGPVQLTFARSVDPIVSSEHSITRMAVTTPEEAEKQQGDNRTMGRKHTVPYGLYRAHGFVSAHLAEHTGFDEKDLELLWNSLENMFNHDRSASRGEMSTRALYIFKHESSLGSAPAHQLFDSIRCQRLSDQGVPRAFTDYRIEFDSAQIPSGVSVEKRV